LVSTTAHVGSPGFLLYTDIIVTCLGHEFSGTIVELAGDILNLQVGQKAAIEPVIADRTCASCQEGIPGACDNFGMYGYSGWEGGGGMAEYIIASPGNVHVVPESISLEVAALVEPLTVPWRALKAAKFKRG
jgi:(R,R)-butanediol dehydrogenase/meso-butanediol dehydrogenase/diacetyl reductase